MILVTSAIRSYTKAPAVAAALSSRQPRPRAAAPRSWRETAPASGASGPLSAVASTAAAIPACVDSASSICCRSGAPTRRCQSGARRAPCIPARVAGAEIEAADAAVARPEGYNLPAPAPAGYRSIDSRFGATNCCCGCRLLEPIARPRSCSRRRGRGRRRCAAERRGSSTRRPRQVGLRVAAIEELGSQRSVSTSRRGPCSARSGRSTGRSRRTDDLESEVHVPIGACAGLNRMFTRDYEDQRGGRRHRCAGTLDARAAFAALERAHGAEVRRRGRRRRKSARSASAAAGASTAPA